jgi:hypothetical protein
MNAWTLRNFLICQPAPATIRLTKDGDTQEITPGRKSRVKIAETILAVGPELVECLDAKGGLIRALRPDDELEQSGSSPAVPAVIAQDPHAAMMSHFANLIHRAYEHAADVAFAKLIELVERMEDRSASIEARLERTEAQYRRLQQDRIDDLYERAEEQTADASKEDPKEQMLAAMMAGAMRGDAAAAAASPNGKGKS